MIFRQGCEASVKELNSLLSLIAEKKNKMEQEEAETNLQILMDFLLILKKKKLDELNEVLELDSLFYGFVIFIFTMLINISGLEPFCPPCMLISRQ